jgi:NAD(P)-dependent dehydrogenase (short-subunit alcohol dehydrogenase family)
MQNLRLRLSMEDKSVLVTGAASGIGRATVLAFVELGARVMAIDVDASGLQETAELAAGGGEVATLVADVTVPEDVVRMVEEVVSRFGRLDVAHNNAGVAGPYLPLDEYDETAFARVLDVDLVAVWRCMKHEIAQMRRQSGGVIVNTSSMLGSAGMAENAAYSAAKHGVHGLTRCAARETASAGVRVNAVAPGVTRSRMTSAVSDELLQAVPLARMAEPAEIAAAVVWLASDAASYVTGAVLVADGGYLA